jgi:hypothetical protein
VAHYTWHPCAVIAAEKRFYLLALSLSSCLEMSHCPSFPLSYPTQFQIMCVL